VRHEAVVGPFAVVDPKPGIGEGTELRDRYKEARVQADREATDIDLD
jgi:hypothetical protein